MRSRSINLKTTFALALPIIVFGGGEIPHSIAATVTPPATIAAPWPSTAGIHVPAGCGAPAPSAHTFYVDPVLGKPTNKGTSASPWDLATALSQAWAAGGGVKGLANPVVHLGDTFLLASGNYGDLLLQGYYGSQVGYDNKSQFLTIKAAPGATPVFTSIRVMGAGGWVFQGLTVKQIAPNLPANNYAALVAIQGDDHDIIFDGNTIESATSVTSWTQANWLANAATGISQGRSDVNGTKCLSFTNNAISNVSYGITTQRADFVLIGGNTINYFVDDGMDFGSNDLVIQHNILTNHVNAGNGLTIHADFMQGQPMPGDTITNVTIDSNIAIRQTDPNLPFAALMASTEGINGIDAFDGWWVNVKVTNNVVITKTQQGISFYGVNGLVVANNDLIFDDLNNTGPVPVITVTKSKSGAESENVVIENNLASGVSPDPKTTNISMNNNAVFLGGNLNYVSGGGTYYYNKPGAYPQGNSVLVYSAPALFESLSLVNGIVTAYDLRLRPGTAPAGAGVTTNAPSAYITGAARAGTMDLGAYPVF